MIIKKFTLYFFILILSISNIFSQTLTDAEKTEVTKYLELVDTYKSQNNINQQVSYLTKIGNIYWNANITDDAITYFKQAIPLSESLGNKNAVITLNNYVGYLYLDKEIYSEAETHFQTSLNTALTLTNKETTSSVYMNLATSQYNQSKYDEAITNLKQAEILGLELNNKTILKKIYSRLAECYLANDNSTEYAKYFKLSENLLLEEKSEIEDEVALSKLIAEKKSLKLIQQETRMKMYEDSLLFAEEKNKKSEVEIELLSNEKKLKELEIAKIDAEKKEAEAEIKKRNTIIYSFILGIAVMTVFILIVFKLLIDKRKANKQLAVINLELNEKNEKINKTNIELNEKNIFIEKQNIELQSKNELIEKQNSDLQIKNQQIEEQHEQITASIDYASKIQKAILPSLKSIMTNFKDAMIYYKPRDVVSGDFYWYSEHGQKKFVATVDCTGHSVPGAFMSLIGNTLLNEIINEKRIFDPAEVLKKLHIGVVNTLHQSVDNETESETDDGMDITLCCYDKEINKVTIASANHVIYLFNKSGFEAIEGDSISIGGYFEKRMEFSFKNHVKDVDNETIIYFFSDGYSDQFGGEFGKKFMTPQFELLIKDIHKYPMKKQEELLEENFQKWKGDRKQVDDILVVGIKF